MNKEESNYILEIKVTDKYGNGTIGRLECTSKYNTKSIVKMVHKLIDEKVKGAGEKKK